MGTPRAGTPALAAADAWDGRHRKEAAIASLSHLQLPCRYIPGKPHEPSAGACSAGASSRRCRAERSQCPRRSLESLVLTPRASEGGPGVGPPGPTPKLTDAPA